MTVQSDNIGAQDRNLVKLMYSGYNPIEKATVLRRKRDGTRQSFPCSVACNRHMGGVDWGDQLRGYYATKLKSRKFYKYIANFLLGATPLFS